MAYPENTINDNGIKYIWDKITAALGNKVDKVTGKGLSTNDYTNEEKALVAIIPDKADADDIAGTKTVSGNPITLTDCAPINAESLVVELEPKQEGSGDPSPTNIRPIIGYTECEVDDVGKNLYGGEKFADDILNTFPYSTQDTTNKTVTYAAWNVDGKTLPFNAFKPNTRYTIILKYSCSVAVAYANLAVLYTDDSYTLLIVPNTAANTVITHSFVTDENKTVKSISGGFYDGSTTVYYEESGVFEGLVPTADFEPYHSSNATIQFGQTVYGGKSNFTEGGTESNRIYTKGGWTQYNASNGYKAYLKNNMPERNVSEGYTADLMSNCINEFGSFSSDNMDRNIIQQPYGGSNRAYMALREDLNPDDVEFSYITTASSTLSTPPTGLKLLQGTNNITTNGTTINLGYQPDNVIGEVKGEIEQHLEMPYVKVIDNNATINFDDISIEYAQEYAYVLADNDFFRHRFILLEIYEMVGGLIRSYVRGSALLSIDTLLEFSGNAYGEQIIFTRNFTIVEVLVGIVEDDGVYKLTISLENDGQTQFNDFRARARYVD